MAVAHKKTRAVELAGGMEASFPAYYRGQNANGLPDHYVSRDEALAMKRAGRAQSIHRGKAILITGCPRKQHDSSRSIPDPRVWSVCGQTTKGGYNGPGMPHWGLQPRG